MSIKLNLNKNFILLSKYKKFRRNELVERNRNNMRKLHLKKKSKELK